ncbi:unnamed protein product [Sphagnum jensenii]
MSSQIRGVIRNFIWDGKDAPARAKVKWETLTLLATQGGLGIIDPQAQFEALLAKLMIRGLSPGGESWKEIIRSKNKRGERLHAGWMHAHQRSLEPSRSGVEKLGRAWNELPRGEHEMQGGLHRQHPLDHVRRSHPSKKRGLGQRPLTSVQPPPRMGLLHHRRNYEPRKGDRVQENDSRRAYSGLHESNNHHSHQLLPSG